MHSTKTTSYLDSAKRTFAIESDALNQTINSLDELDFARVCELLLGCKGRVIVSGIGKSGHIARKIASTLTSTGTPSIFLHPSEAGHGDIGLVSKDDVILILSKSGESDELVSVLSVSVPIIAITSVSTSRLAVTARRSGGVVLYPIIKEEACPNDLAPTSSTTAQLVLGDAIAVALLEARNFTTEDFARLHPGGALGRKLTMRTKDLMVSGDAIPKISPESALPEVMLEISKKRLGAVCVVDTESKLLGIITDGDLRRYFQAHQEIELRKVSAREIMSKVAKTISSESLANEALHLMEDTTPMVMQLPVLNEIGKFIGMIHLHDIVKAGISG